MNGFGRRMRLTLAALIGAVLVGVLGLGAAAVASAQGSAIGGTYVALGDSYTAGPLIPNQHGDPIDCARSDRNYPSLVAEQLRPAKFVDVSCSSAQTKDMTQPQDGLPLGGTNPPQFNALNAETTLVTVGIGGNDAGLVGVAEQCAQLGLFDPNGTACRDFYAPGGNDTVDARIEVARPRIDAVLQGIHERSPKARVAIVGYPNVLPRDGTNCYPTVPLSPDDVRYIDGLIVRINRMIEDEAAVNDADYVDTYSDSIGHDVCKLPPNRWFEGLVPTEPAFPLHPNGKGEASMARSAIAVLSKPAVGKKAPAVSGLRVKPKRIGTARRKALITFNLTEDATITLARKGGKKGKKKGSGSGAKKTRRIKLTIAGTEGLNRVRIRTKDLGKHKGRYKLIATPTQNFVTGDRATARYRIVPPRKQR